MKPSQPLEFLTKAQKDKKLSDRVSAAVLRGAKVTSEEVLQIAREFGYAFTQRDFERDVKRHIAERFAADERVPKKKKMFKKAKPKPVPKPKPPFESSCTKGCLSYTTSWHPS